MISFAKYQWKKRKTMMYGEVCAARFISRPNRFIAYVLLNGNETVCHVKNTGRCKELLIPGVMVLLEHRPQPGRRTEWDLIAVYKGQRLINMDAAAPNAAFGEYLRNGGLGTAPDWVKPETIRGQSRLDFSFSLCGITGYAEVKGVTLEEDGIVRFPDAPTERGVKHLGELTACAAAGIPAWAIFVVQMDGVRWFEPNRRTHPAFADALSRAADAGVLLRALTCTVTPESMVISGETDIHLL